MPVLVTHAETSLGAMLVRRLLTLGGEVRAYGHGPSLDRLRAAGAIVATGDPDDEGRLEAAMEQVHTVVHLGPRLLADQLDAVTVSDETVVRAASQAGVRRLIGLSLPGVDPDSSAERDPLRVAMVRFEQQLRGAGIPTVVVRTSLVDSEELRNALAVSGPLRVDPTVAPLRADDLVELLVAVDDARSSAHTGHVVFVADGPHREQLSDYLERIVVRDADGATSLVGRVWRPPGSFPLLEPALEGPWVSEPSAAALDAWDFFGVTPTGPA